MQDEFYKDLIFMAPIGYALHKIICNKEGTPIDYEYIEINPAFEALTGLKKDQIIGKTVTEVLPDIRDSEFDWIKAYGDIALGGDKQEFEQFSEPLGKWYKVNAYSPKKNHFITFFTDISDSMRITRDMKEIGQHYKKIIDAAKDAIIVIDAKGNVSMWNDSAEKIFGYSLAEAFGQNVHILIAPVSYHKEHFAAFELFRHSGTGNAIDQTMEISAIRKNGEIFPAELSLSAMRIGNEWHGIGVVRDISSRKFSENALRENEKRLMLAQQMAHVGNWELNLATKEIWASKEAFQIYGIPYNSEILPLMEVQSRVALTYRKLLDDALKNLISKNEKYDVEFKLMRMITGEERFVHSIALIQRDDEGNPLKIIGTIQDITEHKRRQDELIHLGYHDQLTGIYNRRFFEEERKRLDTERQLPLSVIFADVNGLKLINDGFGYISGDKLLIAAAKVIRQCCRTEDIVSRIGGDEFCILLPKTTSETAMKISRRIRNACEKTVINLDGGTVKMSISLGQDTKEVDTTDLSDIITNAENLMRRRKLLERKSVRSDLMTSIKATMLEKSHETVEHAERLIMLSKAIGQELNLSDDKLFDLELVATLHDIGKMGIDQKILLKDGALTAEEWNEIRKHPEAGYRIAQATAELMPISDFILSHHERWDGGGYPQGLKGEDIPLLARIISVVDSYDAMTEDRPYRKGLKSEEAEVEILKNSGSQFDPDIVRIFVEKVLKKA